MRPIAVRNLLKPRTAHWMLPQFGLLMQRLGRRRGLLRLAVLIAIATQGLIYLLLLPPWQHYDEPTHFEYAWLIANRGRLPTPQDNDPHMRREVAASMQAHNFYWNLPQPDLFNDQAGLILGVSEIKHPPAYYLLVSLPLRLIHAFDFTTQLYVARLVSLGLFWLTLGCVRGLVADLTTPEHALCWAVPLALALIPGAADVFTAVNNDVAAVASFACWLWAAVRILRHGLGWRRCLWLGGSAILAALTKDTVLLALVLSPVVLGLGLWQRQGWRWRWLALVTAGLSIAAMASLLVWDDPAGWYRWAGAQSQPDSLRQTVTTPEPGYAFTLSAARNPGRYLLQPLRAPAVRQLNGQAVTVGGWIWADAPVTVNAPGLLVGQRATTELRSLTRPIEISSTPQFVTTTFTVPLRTGVIYYQFWGDLRAGQAKRIYLQQPFVIAGHNATLDKSTHQAVTNLVRNADGRATWPRLRPWAERVTLRLLQYAPAHTFAALLDWQQNGGFVLHTIIPHVWVGTFGRFAWGHVAMAGVLWSVLFGSVVLIGALGSVVWLVRMRSQSARLFAPIFLLAFAGGLIWLVALGWSLPWRVASPPLPAARYTFPALVPAVLAVTGGWWTLGPRRCANWRLGLLLTLLTLLNANAIWTIWHFYHNLPAGR